MAIADFDLPSSLSGIVPALRFHEVSNIDRERVEEIGRFRLLVWREETKVNETLFPDGKWLEPLDDVGRHWVVEDRNGLVASARLTIHDILSENPDGYLWERADLFVPVPVAHLCKLVVHSRARGQGMGQRLNSIRVQAAKEMGAKSIIVTASEKNSRLLLALGFVDTGIREVFPNRPGFPFRGLQYLF